MSNQLKSYDDMSYNELFFLLIYHLMKENAHEDKYNFHKKEAKTIVAILNKRDKDNLYNSFNDTDND